jgi:hypothetical protein
MNLEYFYVKNGCYQIKFKKHVALVKPIECFERWLKAQIGMKKTKLKITLKEKGLCLANGKTYGVTLPNILRNKPLRIPKADAKKFPYVKWFLV